MYYVGIDLGGTTIKAGIVDDKGKIVYKDRCPTLVERGAEAVVRDMAALANKIIADGGFALDEIAAVGIGIPGVIDPHTGIVPFCTNLYWHQVPLVRWMNEGIDKPIYVDNDATIAAMAEAVSGVSAGYRSSVFITLGTGVGGGIVLDGKVISGAHGVGSEIGHTIVEAHGELCSCGNKGCLDRYGSATGLIRMAREAAAKHSESKLNDMEDLNAKDVMDAARDGDPAAQIAFDRYTHYLAIAMVNIINFIDPEVIVIGGGVSGAGEFLLQPIREKVKKMVFFKDLPYAAIVQAQLGNDAGIIGAAMLGRK